MRIASFRSLMLATVLPLGLAACGAPAPTSLAEPIKCVTTTQGAVCVTDTDPSATAGSIKIDGAKVRGTVIIRGIECDPATDPMHCEEFDPGVKQAVIIRGIECDPATDPMHCEEFDPGIVIDPVLH